ncbi:hypothetical protein ACEPAG_8322 [Sanghuangporus baumii]
MFSFSRLAVFSLLAATGALPSRDSFTCRQNTSGSCGLNGEGCTLVETTLKNLTTAGSISSSDISLIPLYIRFSVSSGCRYKNGYDGKGADCESRYIPRISYLTLSPRPGNCPQAFHNANDTNVQVACQADNVNLVITFRE